MTPHKVLENASKFQSIYGENWALVEHSLKTAVQFDFGDIIPTEEHKEFGEELFLKGLFRLPFHTVFLTCNVLQSGVSLLAMETPGRLDVVQVGKMTQAGSDIIIPKMMYRISAVRDREERFYFEYGVLSEKLPEPPKEKMHEAAAMIFGVIFSLTTMLLGEEVEQRIEPAPEKLNKVRAGKGKPRINERRVIIVKPHARHALLGKGEKPEGIGSKKAMHFRRGHFRRLAVPRRADGAEVVPVAPALINADLSKIAGPKDYKVGF